MLTTKVTLFPNQAEITNKKVRGSGKRTTTGEMSEYKRLRFINRRWIPRR